MGLDPGQMFQFGDVQPQGVAVERVTVQCIGVQHELAAPGFRALPGGLGGGESRLVRQLICSRSCSAVHCLGSGALSSRGGSGFLQDGRCSNGLFCVPGRIGVLSIVSSIDNEPKRRG